MAPHRRVGARDGLVIVGLVKKALDLTDDERAFVPTGLSGYVAATWDELMAEKREPKRGAQNGTITHPENSVTTGGNQCSRLVGPPGFEPGTSCTPNRTRAKAEMAHFQPLAN